MWNIVLFLTVLLAITPSPTSQTDCPIVYNFNNNNNNNSCTYKVTYDKPIKCS